MNCPQCQKSMMHETFENWIWYEDESGCSDEMRIDEGLWRCECGHVVRDYEDEYEFPDE